MVRNMEKIKQAGALSPEPIILSDENSLWGADVYIAVSKEVPQAQMEKLSGTFLTKVFEGSYKDAGKWASAGGGGGLKVATGFFYGSYTNCTTLDLGRSPSRTSKHEPLSNGYLDWGGYYSTDAAPYGFKKLLGVIGSFYNREDAATWSWTPVGETSFNMCIGYTHMYWLAVGE